MTISIGIDITGDQGGKCLLINGSGERGKQIMVGRIGHLPIIVRRMSQADNDFGLVEVG